MKKKNLLALSALVLSLGLTVSSCAGQPGEKGEQGDKGDQGEQGPQGEQGIPGENGKTYIDVIVLPVENGTIEQDKYAVTEGENETVQFKFTPTNSTDNLVLDLTINNTVVADVITPNEDGELVFELTVDENYKSVQLKAATFSNATTYAKSLVTDALKAISDVDHLVGQNAPDGVNFKYASSQLFDTSLYAMVADANTAIDKASEDNKENGAKAEYDACLEAANNEISKINAAYSDALILAKENAKEDIAALLDSSTYTSLKGNTGYKDEDRTNDLTSANNAIDSATSLEAISNVVATVEVKDGTTTLLNVGSYPQLLTDKQVALNTLDAALSSVTTNEPWMDEENANHDLTITTLEGYGVDVGTLPSAIHSDYVAQVSSAASLEKDSDGNIVLAKAGKEAIEGTVKNIKDQLVQGILNSYIEEIDSSVAIADATNAKNTLKGVVEGAVSNFTYDDRNNTKHISDYISTTRGGLIYLIEEELNYAVTTNGLTAFKTERAQKAVDEAVSQLEAKVAEIKAGDSLYASVFGAVTADGKDNTVENVLSWDETFGNPYAATAVTNGLTDGFNPVTVGTSGNKNPSLDRMLAYYKTSEDSVFVSALKGTINASTFTAITNALNSALTDAQTRYEAVVKDFNDKLVAKYVTPSLRGNTYVTSAGLSTVWTNAKATTMSALATLAQNVSESLEGLDYLDTELVDYVTTKGTEDPDWKALFDGKTGSAAWDAVEDFISDALTNGTTNNAVDTFIASLDDVYASDVASYLTQSRDYVEQIYQNTISNNLGMDKYLAVKATYEAQLALLEGENAPSTVTAINDWVDETSGLLHNASVNNSGADAGLNGGNNSFAGSDVVFKNSDDVTISVGANGNYVVSGTAPKMSAEQAAAFGGADTNTQFVVIEYATDLVGATKRVVGWVATADAKVEDERTLPSDGVQTTILGVAGTGTVRGDNNFYKVEIQNDNGDVLATYIFDFSTLQ